MFEQVSTVSFGSKTVRGRLRSYGHFIRFPEEPSSAVYYAPVERRLHVPKDIRAFVNDLRSSRSVERSLNNLGDGTFINRYNRVRKWVLENRGALSNKVPYFYKSGDKSRRELTDTLIEFVNSDGHRFNAFA